MILSYYLRCKLTNSSYKFYLIVQLISILFPSFTIIIILSKIIKHTVDKKFVNKISLRNNM